MIAIEFLITDVRPTVFNTGCCMIVCSGGLYYTCLCGKVGSVLLTGQEQQNIYVSWLSFKQLLLIWFQDSQKTALMMAAKKGNVTIVWKLLQHGASVNLTNKVNQAFFKLCVLECGMKTAWNRSCPLIYWYWCWVSVVASFWYPLSSSRESFLLISMHSQLLAYLIRYACMRYL